MDKAEYLKRAFDAYNEGRIDSETYMVVLENINIFCEDADEQEEI